MKEQLITFDTAKLAKKKGFEYLPWTWIEKAGKNFEEMLGKISNTDKKYFPTQSLLQKWLREVHKIDVTVIFWERGYLYAVEKRPHKGNHYKIDVYHTTYEEALEKGLLEALKLI